MTTKTTKAAAKAPAKRRTTKATPPPEAVPEPESKPDAVTPPEQEPLPGLEDITGREGGVTYLEKGVRRTIAALFTMGNVQEHHAAHTAAAVELAQIIDAKKQSGRMSTIGNDMRAMIELLDRIVPEKSEMDETLRLAMEAWEAAQGASAEPWSVNMPTPP